MRKHFIVNGLPTITALLGPWCVASVLHSCAIEAGNPSTKKPKGSLNIIFTKTATNSGESMELSLSSIGISSSMDERLSAPSLPMAKNSLELFSSDGSTSETLVQAEISEGSYDQITMTLPSDRVGRFKDDSGVVGDVLPDSSGDTTYYFTETIEIKGEEITEVHVNLDPRRSIQTEGVRRRFKPKGSMAPGKFNTKYQGSAPTNYATACVYHFNAKKPSSRLEGDRHHDQPRLTHRSKSRIESVGAYATRGDIQWDTVVSCPNAFRRVVVSEEKFTIFAVPPGDYAVRFFNDEENFTDGGDFKVEQP